MPLPRLLPHRTQCQGGLADPGAGPHGGGEQLWGGAGGHAGGDMLPCPLQHCQRAARARVRWRAECV